MARATPSLRIITGSPIHHLLRRATAELAWIVLALSLGLTVLAYCILHVRAQHDTNDALRGQAHYGTLAIKARLGLSAELLRSTAAMLMLDRTVQNKSWQQYQRNLANQGWPAEVQQLGYAQRISASEKTALSTAMRADAMPEYQIYPLHDQTAHAPILFIAPDTNNDATARPGFDLMSASDARHALHMAIDSGTIAFHTLNTGGPIRSSAGHTDAARAVLVLPLFPGNANPPSVALRRQQVIGFVFALISINDVLRLTNAAPSRLIRLIELPDSITTRTTAHSADTSEQTVALPFDLFGTRWQAEVLLPVASATHTSTDTAVIVGLCGGIVSVLLFAILRILAAIQRVNRSQSRRTSRAIRQLKQQLSAAMLCTDYAIITVDRRHRIMTFNPAAESIFGVRSDSAIGIGLSRFLPHKLSGAKRIIENAGGTSSPQQVTYRLPNDPDELAQRYHGEKFPFEATIYQCEKEAHPAAMIFLKDLTVDARADAPALPAQPTSTSAMTEARAVDAEQCVKSCDADCLQVAHVDITVGASISNSRLDWRSVSPCFARRNLPHHGARVAAQDDPSAIQLLPIALCEFINTCIHADDRAVVKQQWKRAFASRREVDCVYRMVRSDGEVQIMRHWMTPAGSTGSEQRFVGLMHVLKQEAHREAQQKLLPGPLPEFQTHPQTVSETDPSNASQLEFQYEIQLESRLERRHRSHADLQSTAWRVADERSADAIITDASFEADPLNTSPPLRQPGDRRCRDPIAIETNRLYQQLQSRLLHFDSARDAHQKRLAREMHDDFGQLLTAMKMDLIALQTQLSKSDLRLAQQLGDISDLVDTMVVSVRRIIANLPPEEIEKHGLVKSLELLANAHSHRHKTSCHVQVNTTLPPLDMVLITPIYRIVQEALHNVAKHARATNVDICIECRNHRLHLRVTDNGNGISSLPLAKGGGYGLIGMRERVNNLDGEMTINTAIGIGTTIHIVIPLEVEVTA